MSGFRVRLKSLHLTPYEELDYLTGTTWIYLHCTRFGDTLEVAINLCFIRVLCVVTLVCECPNLHTFEGVNHIALAVYTAGKLRLNMSGRKHSGSFF